MDRTTVFAVVEGYSENGFLTGLIASHLGELGVDFSAKIVGEGSSRGGMSCRTFGQICSEIARLLRDRRKPHVTTFFDYYGLPTSSNGGWEFVKPAKSRGAHRGAEDIENRFADAVGGIIGRNDCAGRFIPYLQLHELEALFYAEPDVLAETLGKPSLAASFQRIVAECSGCESINDTPQTAPSKRLEKLFRGYIKGRSASAHAPRLARKLDLAKVRSACPRFNDWLTRLESLRGVSGTSDTV